MLNNFNDVNTIENLERRLSESLKPIHPDPTFINSLKEKLSKGTPVMVERQTSHHGLIILGVGLITGLVFAWWLKRRPL